MLDSTCASGILLGPFVSGLLAIMSMAMVYAVRTNSNVVNRLKDKYGKLWLAAEVVLFVLVGAAVDIRYTLSAGLGAVAMIFVGLAFRSVGVFLCLLGTELNKKSGSTPSLPIFPRQRCRPPSEPFRSPWDCRAETSFCRSPFSASSSPHRLARS